MGTEYETTLPLFLHEAQEAMHMMHKGRLTKRSNVKVTGTPTYNPTLAAVIEEE